MGDVANIVTTKISSRATVNPERAIGPAASSKRQKSRARAAAAAKNMRGPSVNSTLIRASRKGTTTIKEPRSSKRIRTAAATPSNAAPTPQAPIPIKPSQPPATTTTTTTSTGIPAPTATPGVNECVALSARRHLDYDDASGRRAAGQAGALPCPTRAHGDATANADVGVDSKANGNGDGDAMRPPLPPSAQRDTNRAGGDDEEGSRSGGGGDSASRGPICGGPGAVRPNGGDTEPATTTRGGGDGIRNSEGDAGTHPGAPLTTATAAADIAAGTTVAVVATAAPVALELKWTEASLSYMFNTVKSDLADGRKPDYPAIVRQLGWHTHPAPARVKKKVQTKYSFMRGMVGCGVAAPYERFEAPAHGQHALRDKVREVLLACPGKQATVREVRSALVGDPTVEPLLDRRAAVTDSGRAARWEKQVSRILARPHHGFVSTGRKRKGRCVYMYDPNLDIRLIGRDFETTNTQRQTAPVAAEPTSQPGPAPAAAATREGDAQEGPRQPQQHPERKEAAGQQLQASPTVAGPSSTAAPSQHSAHPQASPLANGPRLGGPCYPAGDRNASGTQKGDAEASGPSEPARGSKEMGPASAARQQGGTANENLFGAGNSTRKESRKERRNLEELADGKLGAGSMHVGVDDPMAAAVAAALASLEQGLDVQEEDLELVVLQGQSAGRGR